MTDLRPIHLAQLAEKTRPVVILTRQGVIGRVNAVTVAPITSTVRGLSIEVQVGPQNGLDHLSVINCDNLQTVLKSRIGRHIGFLLPSQEEALATAIVYAFDLALLP